MQKAEALTFGTLKSKLWKIPDAGHYEVRFARDEIQRARCWTDLNCPSWPDYFYRLERTGLQAARPIS